MHADLDGVLDAPAVTGHQGHLEHKVDVALNAARAGSALAVVAFVAVLREGLEAALFLVAAATDTDAAEVVLGAVAGIAGAAVLAGAVYVGSRRIPMRAFFQLTGVIVIVFAAGLLARTVLFLQSSGDVGSFDDALYDLTGFEWLTQSSEVGKFLAAMFGWDPRPSIEQVVVWIGYLLPVTVLFARPGNDGRPEGADGDERPFSPGSGASREIAVRTELSRRS